MIVFPEPDGLYRERLKIGAENADSRKLLRTIIDVLGPLELNMVGELLDLPRSTVRASDVTTVAPIETGAQGLQLRGS